MAPPDTPALTSPRIYLVRMGVFIVLAGFVAFILYRPIWAAFQANPGLNGLIFFALFVGIVLALRQVQRLFREVRWVNEVQHVPEGAAPPRPPVLLAPMAALIGNRANRLSLPVSTTRSLLDSIAGRLDENRELVRYLAGSLILMGLVGTFWGLIDIVQSLGRIIGSLRGGTDAGGSFNDLKNGLQPVLEGMGLAFSTSLFGVAGSLILGFLDLQTGQAQGRFYTELENWLSASTVDGASTAVAEPVAAGPTSNDLAIALTRLNATVQEGGGGRAATQAMANLAEGIQGLVQHMRAEQQMIRDWVEAQAAREKELRQVLERLSRERIT